LIDICSGLDTLVSETQSGNGTLGSIDGYVLKIDDALQPKAFNIVSTASAPAVLPFSGGFVFGSGVWKKIVCETSQTCGNGGGLFGGGIITTFFDVSGAPAGTEPVLLRLNHPTMNQYFANNIFVGTSYHDIDLPDGGLLFENGIGVSCVVSGGVGTTFQSLALTLYTT
jgi:hypothetical protein